MKICKVATKIAGVTTVLDEMTIVVSIGIEEPTTKHAPEDYSDDKRIDAVAIETMSGQWHP